MTEPLWRQALPAAREVVAAETGAWGKVLETGPAGSAPAFLKDALLREDRGLAGRLEVRAREGALWVRCFPPGRRPPPVLREVVRAPETDEERRRRLRVPGWAGEG